MRYAYAVITITALLGDLIPFAKARSTPDDKRRRCYSKAGLSLAAEQVDERGVSKTTYNSQCDLGRFQHAVRYGADRSDDRDAIRFPRIPHCANY